MKKKCLAQRLRHSPRHMRHSLRHMRLSDRCLCLFLLFLLLQSAWLIFLPPDLTKEFDAMDAMIRSSAATIFGYFISNAFGSMPEKSENEIPLESREKIPAESPSEEAPLPSGTNCRIRQQILIVAGVGFFSLVILTFVRMCTSPSQDAIASLSQFQDFLVGSIGFLVGHAKYERA